MTKHRRNLTDTVRPRYDRGELPDGWYKVPLGDVLAYSKEKVDPAVEPKAPYVGLEHIESGTRRLLEKGKAGDVRSTKSAFHTGELLYGKLRPYLKKVFRADFAGVCSTDILVLQPTEAVEPKLAERLLASDGFTEFAVATSAGINLPRTSYEKIAAFAFPLPPLPEQRRIVAKLEKFEARIRRIREQLAPVPGLIAQARRSLLDAAFRGELTNRRRTSAGKLTPAPSLPIGWHWKTVGELTTDIEAGRSFRCIERPPEGDEMGIVKVSAVTWGEFDERESKTVQHVSMLDAAHRICVGDLLISRANTVDLVGACVLVKHCGKRLFLSDKTLRLCAPKHVRPWLLWFLRSPTGRGLLMAASSGNQTSMRNIGQAALRAITVPLAPPAERSCIVRRLDRAFARLDALAAAHRAAVADLDTLEQALLAKAFRGELVPQDPRDEPAAALLARIRQSREAVDSVIPPAPRAMAVRATGRRPVRPCLG